MQDFAGKVAVVTGGASGIGAGLVEALLREGAKVVVADVEQPVLDETLGRLASLGDVSGVVTDVSDAASVDACAEEVYARHGACHLVFNNAGVGGGGVAKPWNWTSNDWRWCIGVNVFGVGHSIAAFVPRMIDGGEEGWVVNTSSDNGGYQPLPDLAVYAASKAAVTTITECLENAFRNEDTRLHASVFYPGGNGLLETRLWNSGRNRPAALAREHPHVDQQWDYQEHKARMEEQGVKVADLVELGQSVLQGVREGRFIIQWNVAPSGELMKQRAERIGRGELPTIKRGGAFE
ncbi:MAG TPA: SDR family NAD(P)-dependent oxidoreductase [Acidimicrobiia bacterium]|jgi:NAD(P)-dependent dehydrogenase (short-subunit alcohol dehydrogenase family)